MNPPGSGLKYRGSTPCSNKVFTLKSSSMKSSLSALDSWQKWASPDQSIHGYYKENPTSRRSLHFLHGTGFCATSLLSCAQDLSDEQSIWLTDVPGHGDSLEPESYRRHQTMPNWMEMAQSVGSGLKSSFSHWMDDADSHERVGIGHSMGGVLTLMLAAQQPGLFDRIILLDPVLFLPWMISSQKFFRKTGLWQKSELVKKVSNRTPHWPDEAAMRRELSDKALFKHWHQDAFDGYIFGASKAKEGRLKLACDPAWESQIFGSFPDKLWKAVRQVDCRVDIVVAQKSYFFIPSAVKKAAKLNKNVHWQVFGDKHCFPMEQPSETADVLRRLLNT